MDIELKRVGPPVIFCQYKSGHFIFDGKVYMKFADNVVLSPAGKEISDSTEWSHRMIEPCQIVQAAPRPGNTIYNWLHPDIPDWVTVIYRQPTLLIGASHQGHEINQSGWVPKNGKSPNYNAVILPLDVMNFIPAWQDSYETRPELAPAVD